MCDSSHGANFFFLLLQAFLKSGRPLLLGSGLPEAYVDELTQLAHNEVEAAQTVTFCRVESVYARKREAF